jgi:hypothetical protein
MFDLVGYKAGDVHRGTPTYRQLRMDMPGFLKTSDSGPEWSFARLIHGMERKVPEAKHAIMAGDDDVIGVRPAR